MIEFNLPAINNAELQETDEQQILAMLQGEVQTALENIDPRPPTIKINKDLRAFVMPDGTTTAKTLTGIILFHHKARGYWEEEGQDIPTCSSMDGHTGTYEGQDGNPKTRPCSDVNCPYNQFGSDLKGGPGKACKEMRWIYFLQDGEVIPSRISLPPTSLRAFDTFITALAQKRIAPVQKIVTLNLTGAESRGFSYAVLTQPEIMGDVSLQAIPGLIKMRETVVAAAKKAGIRADDYYADDNNTSSDEPF